MNKVFSKENSSCVKSLWWPLAAMQKSSNEKKNQVISEMMGFTEKNDGNTSNGVALIDKVNIQILEI